MLKKFCSLVLIGLCVLAIPNMVYAKDATLNISGNVYEFSDKENYTFSSSASSVKTSEQNTMGTLTVSGSAKDAGEKDGFEMYEVSSGNLTFSYSFDASILDASETDWHLIEDKSKKVDTFSLSKDIKQGAVIVQSSKNGTDWITDYQLCDAFKTADTIGNSIYTTKDVQLENECYYRVIVIYELQRKTGEQKIAFITKDVTEEKRVAEVYSFYAVNKENAGNTMSAADEPRKEIASKPIKTEKDKGFSGEKVIDKDDPHFGWALGTFVINGYTREISDGSNNIYLKNVRDKVTLWFTLNQDINKLNNNENYSIANDKKAYDQEFGVSETSFGHGALIVSYTDYQGKTHDPVIYTDFLAANATTGADTRVQLFEEGDYKVTLDYEIKNTPRKVGSVEVIPEYTDYKIEFSFSIRNGNCMVYPSDIETGDELSNNAITENGFKLDKAKSRYLDVDVIKTVLKVSSDGFLSEDVRFNRPAKDNESYEDEGIYTFSVKNLYTGATTTKIIYVGDNKYYKALSKNNLTVDALNERIAEGYTIENDGTLTEPFVEPEPVPETEPETTTQETTESVEMTEATVESATSVETSPAEETIVDETTESEEAAEVGKTNKSDGSPLPFILFGLVVAGGGVAAVAMKQGKKKGGAE